MEHNKDYRTTKNRGKLSDVFSQHVEETGMMEQHGMISNRI